MEAKQTSYYPTTTTSLSPIRVVIIDDQRLFRLGLKSLLENIPDIEVVGEADSAEAGLRLCQEKEAEVVLLDANLPGHTAPGFIQELQKEYPKAQVIAMADCAEEHCVILHPEQDPSAHCWVAEEPHREEPEDCLLLSLRAGAKGALRKTCQVNELTRAIRNVYRGEYWMEMETASRLISLLRKPPSKEEANPMHEGLTRRQVAVIRELLRGRSNKEIAKILGIREQTVKNVMSEIFERLNVEDRLQLVLYAINTHLLERYSSLL